MLNAWVDIPFERVPEERKATVFGVEYVRLVLESGDELLLTAYGWPWRAHLMPDRWYAGGSLRGAGVRLGNSTGTVYRVAVASESSQVQFIAKISRFAQYLDREGLLTTSPVEPTLTPAFNSPFEEFARVLELRSSVRRPRMLTKRPLAIFSPEKRYESWQLGRCASTFDRHARRIAEDQEHNGSLNVVSLDPLRDYLTVFSWTAGETLLELVARRLISETRMREISAGAMVDLRRHGFTVLDHKPDHVVVRTRPGDRLPFREGRLVYALTDYELLVRAD